jgi:general secretion pathway protein G
MNWTCHDRRRGFTLLEILVVVMIITILATVVGLNVLKEPGKARVTVAKSQIGVFRSALQQYKMENGRYPTQAQGLSALCEKPSVDPVPDHYPADGYLESRKIPSDPWSHEYVYLAPGPNGEPFVVISYGADGEPGGAGEDADLSSSDV